MAGVPICDEEEVSLNIEMEGDAEAWDPDAPPKGGGSEGAKAAEIEEKLLKQFEDYIKFLTDLIEEVNKPVFRCLVESWVDKKKIRKIARKMAKIAIAKAKRAADTGSKAGDAGGAAQSPC